MSVLSRVNWVAQQRVDLSDFLAMESFNAFDIRALLTTFVDVDRPFVVRGLEGVSKSGLTVGVRVANSQVFNPLDGSGAFYVGLADDADVQIDLPADQTNIFVEAQFVNQSQSPINRGVWDPLSLVGEDASGQEFTSAVDFQSVMVLEINVNTVGFSEGAIPLFRASTNASAITNLIDSRPLLFRLGSGGANPDPLRKYEWSSTRTEPVPAGTGVGDAVDSPWRSRDASGVLNDKGFRSFKDWADAVMSRFSEISGSSIWYAASASSSPAGNVSLNQLFFDTIGHSIQPSKNAAFKWASDGGSLKLLGEGTGILNGTTSSYHNGLVRWKSNYSALQWELGGTFVSNVPGGKRNYTAAGLRFASAAPVSGGNVYLGLEREVPKGSGASVDWADNSQEGSFSPNRAVSGQLGDFTGIALGDYIRKESEGYSRYLKVVKMSDGSNIYDNTVDAEENRVADTAIVCLELDGDILSSTSTEPLRFFRSRYGDADLVADTVAGVHSFTDANFYWLGRREGSLFIMREGWASLQEGEEVTTMDLAHSEGQRPEGSLSYEHAKDARYDATNGYELQGGPGTLLTIRRRKRDNTVESPTPGSDNSDASLTYIIDTDPGMMSVGDGLWVRLSDLSGGTLASGSVTNTTDDEDNTDVTTNKYEVRSAANNPARTFDNKDVHLVARRIDVNGQPALIFADGSVLSTFGTTLNNNVEITDQVKLTAFADTAIPFLAEDGSKEVHTDVANFFYNENTNTFGLHNLRWINGDLQQATPDDYALFSNLGSHTLTVGDTDSTIHILGDLIVDGDKIIANVTQFQTQDKLATFNIGGGSNTAQGGGVEFADNTQTATQVDSSIGQLYVDITFAAPPGYTTGDRIGVAATEDVGGITAGQISGEYTVVASGASQGDAEVTGANTLRIWTNSGGATSTATANTTPPDVFMAPWSIRIGTAAGAYNGVTSWVFAVKNETTTPTLTPVTDYGIVPTAHETTMLEGRIPFVNADNEGPAGVDSTLNFSPNFTWNNSTNTFNVVGTFNLGGNLLPDTDCAYDIGEDGTPLRWRKLYLCTGASGGVSIGDSNLYETAADVLRTDDSLEIAEGLFLEKFADFDDVTTTVPADGKLRVFGSAEIMSQRSSDSSTVSLANLNNRMHEIVEVVAAPTGNNEMSVVAAPNDTRTLPLDTKFLLGRGNTLGADGSTSTVNVKKRSHGLSNGDTVRVMSSVDIGGILAAELSGTFTITVVDAHNFTYTSTGTSTSVESASSDWVKAVKVRDYEVGSGEFKVWINGKLAKLGDDYLEVGNEGDLSTQIEWLHLLVDGDYVEYEILQTR